jgi:hypothetical protein
VEATRVEPGVIEHLSPFADYALSAQHRGMVVDPGARLRGAGLDVDSSAPDDAVLLWRKLSFLAPLALLTTRARDAPGPAREARPDLLDALVEESAAAAAAHQVPIDPIAIRDRLLTLPTGMRSSMLKDALAGVTLELEAIAGPVVRGAPNDAAGNPRSRRRDRRGIHVAVLTSCRCGLASTRCAAFGGPDNPVLWRRPWGEGPFCGLRAVVRPGWLAPQPARILCRPASRCGLPDRKRLCRLHGSPLATA